MRQAARKFTKEKVPQANVALAWQLWQVGKGSLADSIIIDRDARAIVYQVVDNRTNLVVRQFPEEAVLRRRAYFHALDLSKDAPTRARATDRRA